MYKKYAMVIILVLGVLSMSTPMTVSGKENINTNQTFQQHQISKPLNIPGIVNIRDLGGYRNVHGQMIKYNRLFRSGKLSNINKNGINQLNNRHLDTVIDFRTTSKRNAYPDVIIRGVHYVIDPVHSDHAAKITKTILHKDGLSRAKQYTYSHFVTTNQARRAYHKMFQQLLNNSDNHSILYHCSMGKDRTGFATALILNSLGFNKAMIKQDYLLSNNYSIGGHPVKLKYLNDAYRAMDKHYGSIRKYLIKGLGLTHHDIRQLRKQYLTK